MKLYGKHTNEVAHRIVEAFKEPQRLPKALAPIFIHRNDDIPCRRWSWHNQLLVALACTTDARGIRQWNKVGRKVVKGSKAVYILTPCLKTVRETDTHGQGVKRQILFGFWSAPVFAVEDTEGDTLPDHDDTYDAWLQSLPFVEVAKAWNIHVDAFSHYEGDPLGYYRYASTGNKAVLLGTENLSTWTHELIHAADHRLTGLKGEKWHKEVVAELGGAILLECVGQTHDADLGGAHSYIQSYASHAKKDTVKACIEVLDRTCNCVKLILDTAEQLQVAAAPSAV